MPATKPPLDILLCSPRGFCAGVDRAIQIVELALQKYGAPVYVRHEIVHNRYVVDSLKAKGAVFVNATGVDLPPALLDGVHAVFVDDPEGLADSDRTFVRTHPGRRRFGRGHRSPSVVADLGRVLAGEHPGRTDHDHVLLVELIGGGTELDPVLAGRIHQAAAAAGLGTFVGN